MKIVPEDLWATWADGMGGTFRAGRYVQNTPPVVEPVDELLALDGYEENPFYVKLDVDATLDSNWSEFYAQPALTQKLLTAEASK